VAHDQLRDAPDGVERGREPSDVDMRAPHERDESADASKAVQPRPLIKRGHDDLAAGRVDTETRDDAGRNFDRAVRRAAKHGGSR
jgi:hypothetical protein